MVGFAADGASTMFSDGPNCVSERLKKVIPNLYVMKCLCHSLALAVSYAAKVLPEDLHSLLHDIYRYLKYSSKRQQNLQKFQALFDLSEHKILRLFKLRWLSLKVVVSRFLEQYDALFEFFKEETKSKKKKTAEAAGRIFKVLQNRFTIMYLQFLDFILPLLTRQNLEFQSEKPRVHEIHSKMESLFKTIAS